MDSVDELFMDIQVDSASWMAKAKKHKETIQNNIAFVGVVNVNPFTYPIYEGHNSLTFGLGSNNEIAHLIWSLIKDNKLEAHIKKLLK